MVAKMSVKRAAPFSYSFTYPYTKRIFTCFVNVNVYRYAVNVNAEGVCGEAPKGRLHLSPGQAERSPGSGKTKFCGLKGHFKNDRRRGFEVPLQGTRMRGDATRGGASLAPGYGASGPFGRWSAAKIPVP
jgi:hypothetical protein